MPGNGTIGRLGEDAAAAWLERHGFRIVERNWRYGRYEIDIIACKDGGLRIVEVKCRAEGGLTSPAEAYTAAKFTALARAAEEYVRCNNIDADTHFDLVCVTHCHGRFNVEYIPDVMSPAW